MYRKLSCGVHFSTIHDVECLRLFALAHDHITLVAWLTNPPFKGGVNTHTFVEIAFSTISVRFESAEII